jgi:uncharacterized protein involved in outer membrane biogenesis
VSRRIKVWLASAAVFTAAVTVAVVWGLPVLVQSQAQQRLSALLGREVTIGRVETSLWRLAVDFGDVRVAARDAAQPPQLELRRLAVDARWRSLWAGAPVLDRLTVEAPRLRLRVLADGSTDVDDIRARLATDDAGAAPAADAPPKFALHNIRVSDGELHVADEGAGLVHEVRAFDLGLPFLSSLPLDAEIDVEPRLAFVLNGAAFDTGGASTPFAPHRRTRMTLRIGDLDLAPYLPYLPRDWPFALRAARLAGEVRVDFEVGADRQPRVTLSGHATARDVALEGVVSGDATLAPRARWAALEVALADVQPLQRRVQLGRVALRGLQLELGRDARGALVGPVSGTASPPAASTSPPPAASPWQVAVERVELDDARLRWRDAAVRPAVDWQFAPITAAAGPLAWPTTAPVPLQFSVAGPVEAGGAAATTVSGEGEFTAERARVRVDVRPLELQRVAPYVATFLTPRIEGRVAGQLALEWAGGDAPALVVALPSAAVDGLRVRDAPRGELAAAWRRLEVADATVDLRARRVRLAQLTLTQPSARLRRDAQGRWNVLQWFAAADASGAAAAGGSTAAGAGQAPWQLQAAQLRIDGGRLQFADERPAPPSAGAPAGASAPAAVAFELRGLRADVRDVQWPQGPQAPAARVQLATRIETAAAATAADDATATRTEGRLDLRGRARVQPLGFTGTLDAERLPLHAFMPYVGAALDVDVVRAQASWRGPLDVRQAPQGWAVSVRGDGALGDVRVHTRGSDARTGSELIGWQSLALRQVAVEVPAGGRPSIELGEVVWSDFDTRLVLDEQGRFNLRDVAAARAAGGAATPAPAAPGGAAPDSAPPPAAPASDAAPSAAAPSAGFGASWPFDLAVGGVQFVNGRVDFTDRFIRPNYHAELTGLNGRLGAFRSGTREMAALELRGKAAGTADLEIRGALNPSADPLALDIQARATGLELAPLSPYAGKYAGYTIERGKLSVDVAYRIDPDGRLEARNQVILNQLTFGEKVDSPLATKLPIKFALALLSDRNGVVDINLPIRGSINDPQFSIWGLVWRIVGNLIVKVVTAPFAVFAGGGGPELSRVEFVAGTPAFAPSAADVLDRVAKAMADRPALRMTVAGSADRDIERDAIRRAALQARLVAEQRKDALRAGAAADAPLPPLTGEAREALIARLYRETPLPDKPRNVLGLPKAIPPSEMEARLLAAIPVDDNAVRELALQRGLAVREALVARGMEPDRLFLGAPKLRAGGAAAPAGAASTAAGDPAADGAADAAADTAPWTPRAELSLALR